MNTNIYDRNDYHKSGSSLKTDEDVLDCLKHIRNSPELCQGAYSEKDIHKFIEMSEYFLFRREKTTKKIVAFALLRKLRSKIVDVVLVCTVPNNKRFGNMIAYDIFQYCVNNKCTRIVTEPRTQELQNTFKKYGFEPLHGNVLEKEIVVQQILKTNTTRKVIRPKRT